MSFTVINSPRLIYNKEHISSISRDAYGILKKNVQQSLLHAYTGCDTHSSNGHLHLRASSQRPLIKVNHQSLCYIFTLKCYLSFSTPKMKTKLSRYSLSNLQCYSSEEHRAPSDYNCTLYQLASQGSAID